MPGECGDYIFNSPPMLPKIAVVCDWYGGAKCAAPANAADYTHCKTARDDLYYDE